MQQWAIENSTQKMQYLFYIEFTPQYVIQPQVMQLQTPSLQALELKTVVQLLNPAQKLQILHLQTTQLSKSALELLAIQPELKVLFSS